MERIGIKDIQSRGDKIFHKLKLTSLPGGNVTSRWWHHDWIAPLAFIQVDAE